MKALTLVPDEAPGACLCLRVARGPDFSSLAGALGRKVLQSG